MIKLFGGPAAARGPIAAVLGVVWFLLVPALTGSTVGKRAMLLRIERTGRPAAPGRSRCSCATGCCCRHCGCSWLALSVDHWDVFGSPQQLLIPLGMLLSLFVVGIWTPLAVFFGDEPAPHERLSRTHNVAIVDGAEPRAREPQAS